MDPPQSFSILNDVAEDNGEIAEPNRPHMSQDQAPAERDNVFYFETVTFQVEDTLFRVIKSDFEVQGTPFEAFFSLPHTPSKIVEGTDDSSPIYLHGISEVKFRSFLRVLYPFKGAVTTYAEWIAALELAIMWDFKEIRMTCIEALSELIKSRTAIDKIVLGKKYNVKKWLRDGYVQLLKSKELELGDDICTSEIDMMTLARLLYIRERKHCELKTDEACCPRCYHRFSTHSGHIFSTIVANRKIDEVFADEISGMQDD